MDRMIFTALNSIKNLHDIRISTAHNLSSVDIPGYRSDLPNEGGSAFVQALIRRLLVFSILKLVKQVSPIFRVPLSKLV